MTLEEMIRELGMQGQNDEDDWVCVLDGPLADQIIKLLKVGQELQDAVRLYVYATVGALEIQDEWVPEGFWELKDIIDAATK